MLNLKSISQTAATGLLVLIPLFGIADDQKAGDPKKGTKPRVDAIRSKKAADAQSTNTARTASVPVYKPPLRGAPGGRVGGGSRDREETSPLVYVLAPDHVGLTLQEQPVLYWYLSSLTTHPIELTLIEDTGVKPLVEKRITAVFRPGIQQIALNDYGIHLELGILYRWFVAVVVDPENRSKDTLAGGFIERVHLAALHAELARGDKKETVRIYAESGIWYDALFAISQMIDASPNDPMLRQERESLLEQVGL